MEKLKGWVVWHPDYGVLPATEDGGVFVSEDIEILVLNRKMTRDGWRIRPVELRLTDEEPKHE